MLVASPPCREHFPGAEEGFHGGGNEVDGPHALGAASGCLDLAGVDGGASAGGLSRPETVRTDATFDDRVASELLPTVDRQEAVRSDANFEDQVVAELLPAADRQEAVRGGGASFEDTVAAELLPAVDRQEAVRSDLAFEDSVVAELERRNSSSFGVHPASTAASLEEEVAARVAPGRDAHCHEDEQPAPPAGIHPVSTVASFEDRVATWLAPRYEDGLDPSDAGLRRPSGAASMVASSAGLRPVSTAASLEDSVANRLLLGTCPPTPSAPSAPKQERAAPPKFGRASPAVRSLARRNESERQLLEGQGWHRKWGKEWTYGYPTDRQLLRHADAVTTDREPASVRARRSGGRAVEPLPSVQKDSHRCAPPNTGKLTREERIRLRSTRSVPNVRSYPKDIDSAKEMTYAKGIDLLSLEGFERRANFKTMKAQQRDKLSLKAWSAVYNSQASKHPFEKWYSSSGIRRPWPEHAGHQ